MNLKGIGVKIKSTHFTGQEIGGHGHSCRYKMSEGWLFFDFFFLNEDTKEKLIDFTTYANEIRNLFAHSRLRRNFEFEISKQHKILF